MFLGSNPFPSGIAPEAAAFIATFADEPQIVSVGYVVSIDCKCGDFDAMLLEFIVPAERPVFNTASQPKRGRAIGDFHAVQAARRHRGWRSHWLTRFAVHVQLVQHVAERFDMHQSMFDGNFEKAAMFEARESRVFRAEGANRGVQLLAKSLVVSPNPVGRGPILGLIRRQASFYWINAKGEEFVKVRVEGRKAEGFAEKIPVKRLQMPHIKNNPVAFRDGAVVKCFRADNFEKFFASSARHLESCKKLIGPGRWRHCCRIHEVLLSNSFILQRLGRPAERSATPRETIV